MDNVQVRLNVSIIFNISQDKVQILTGPRTEEEKSCFLRRGIKAQRITLNASQFRLLEDIRKLPIEMLARILIYLVPVLKLEKEEIKGKVEGLKLKWPEIDIRYEDIRYEGIKIRRESISVAEGIMYMLTHKPDWICKGSKSGNFADRLIMGFEDKGIVIYEGLGATYKTLEDGLKYYDTKEKLKNIRKKADVEYVCHTSKEKWLSRFEQWFPK